MRSKNVFFYVLFFVLLSLPACKSQKAEGTSTGLLAKVNGVAITEDDRYLLLEGGHGGMDTPQMREQALQDLINKELLYQQGLRLGLDKDAKYRNMVKVMEMRLKELKRSEMARRVASTQIAATVNVTNEDVDKYIEANMEHLRNEYRLGMITFAGEAEAQSALAGIRSGATFESMAWGRYPLAQKTGKAPWDLGYLRWHQIPPEWREAVERLEESGVSPVLQGKRTGISIIKLIDRKQDPKADLGGLRAGIMNYLRDEKLAAAYEEYLKRLRYKAKIITYEERGKSLEK